MTDSVHHTAQISDWDYLQYKAELTIRTVNARSKIFVPCCVSVRCSLPAW